MKENFAAICLSDAPVLLVFLEKDAGVQTYDAGDHQAILLLRQLVLILSPGHILNNWEDLPDEQDRSTGILCSSLSVSRWVLRTRLFLHRGNSSTASWPLFTYFPRNRLKWRWLLVHRK